MADTRDWLYVAGGMVLILLFYHFGTPIVCPADGPIYAPLRWLLFC